MAREPKRGRVGPRWLAAVALLLAVAFLAAACSNADDSGVASLGGGTAAEDTDAGEQNMEEAILEFTQCMRDHGIDVEDPTFDEEGRPQFGFGGGGGPGNAEDEEFQEAMEACGDLLEDAFGDFQPDPEQQAEFQDRILEYAQCMRDQGIDLPDPDFSGGGGPFGGGDDGEPPFDPDDPEFVAANEACRDILGDLAGPGGPGGAGGGGGDGDA